MIINKDSDSCYKLKMYVRGFLISMLTIFFLNPSDVISADKVPAKPKPKKIFSYENRLPDPFDRWSECDAAQKLYPEYNCTKETLDAERGGVVSSVSIWKNSGRKRVVMLFETYYLKESGFPGSPKVVDIALFDVKDNSLILTAYLKEALGYRWYGYSQFDLAPYRLNSSEIAIGIRMGEGISGGLFGETLYLFRIVGKEIKEVFSRTIAKDVSFESPSGDGSSIPIRIESTLDVITMQAGLNKFKIVNRYYQIGEDDKVDRNKVIKSTEEIWQMNDKTQRYELSEGVPRHVVKNRRKPVSAPQP